MRYEIKGGAFPVVVCELADGEQMITEKGSMVWMSPNMQMDTRGGGLGKMFSKAFSGESIFQNIYTARGAGMIAFGSSFPGQIKAVTIAPGQDMILQKTAFLAAEPGVELSIHFNKKLGTGLFGGEGFIMQRLSGSGVAFAEIDGELVEYELREGQQIVADTGNVAGFTAGVKMEIQQVPGMKNKLLGGEAGSGSRPCPSPAWRRPSGPISLPATADVPLNEAVRKSRRRKPAGCFFQIVQRQRIALKDTCGKSAWDRKLRHVRPGGL